MQNPLELEYFYTLQMSLGLYKQHQMQNSFAKSLGDALMFIQESNGALFNLQENLCLHQVSIVVEEYKLPFVRY